MSFRSASLAILAASLTSVRAAAPYCLAGDDCFPADDLLSSFNATVGGNLIKAEPYGAACYAAIYDEQQCKTLANTARTFDFVESLPAGVQYINWEINNAGEGCPVPLAPEDGSAPRPIQEDCTLGNMPSYVLKAGSAEHVAAGVKFAAEHNLRLRIKNSGHDYTGRSSGEGAFSIWTRHMNDAKLVQGFVPEGVDAKPHDVVSAGPGVNVEELNAWGAANERVTIGGYTPTVGATGGYLIGGGFGPTAPLFGMGVDNALQFQVVTADGKIQLANAATNPDLYWALRGGGGAFGVVTRVWLKAYPALAGLNTVAGPVICEDRASYENLIDVLVDLQAPLYDAKHSGIWSASGASNSLLLISMQIVAAGSELRPVNATLADLDPLTTVEGCTAQLKGARFSGPTGYNDAYQGAIWPTAGLSANPGSNLVDVSRLVSNDMLADAGKIDSIKDFIKKVPDDIPAIWQNNCGGVTQDVPTDATPMHPDWRKAAAWMVLPVKGPWDGLTSEQNRSAAALSESLTATFGTTSYYNEQSGFLENWQDSWWGSNYDRLLEIKSAVDPDGVFSCRFCVGSENGY